MYPAAVARFCQAGFGQTKLLDVLEDENDCDADFCIYNNLAVARTNRPLFVTFRCVPCVDCKGFDAEVAKNNQRIKTLEKEAFAAVRQVKMKESRVKSLLLTKGVKPLEVNWINTGRPEGRNTKRVRFDWPLTDRD